MKHVFRLAQIVTAVTLALWAVPAHADVQLTMRNGHVTLVAKDATLRQILAEWARVGNTQIVNGDRVPGGPISLELSDMPEKQALDILLRSVSGYLAAPRQSPLPNASYFDRIFVVPTATAPRTAVSNAPALLPQPSTFRTVPNDFDDAPPIQNPQAARQPVTTTFTLPPAPGAALTAPSDPGRAPSSPTYSAPSGSGARVGTPTPGVIMQPQPVTAPGR